MSEGLCASAGNLLLCGSGKNFMKCEESTWNVFVRMRMFPKKNFILKDERK